MREKEKEKEENPLLSSRSFRLPTSRTKMTPVATLNTRRLLRNHLLTAFPCRKEITDTAISCEGSETRAEKLFQRSSIRLPKRGYLHESLLNLPIYRFFTVFPASSPVLSTVHSALSLSLSLSIYLSLSWLVSSNRGFFRSSTLARATWLSLFDPFNAAFQRRKLHAPCKVA